MPDTVKGNTPPTLDKVRAATHSTWVSVVVNLSLSITQIVVGGIAHSQGLIADGIHSLSDLMADFVVLYASQHSHKAADSNHPYGHQRFENAASLVLGVLLIAVGLGMLVNALTKLQNPDTIQRVHIEALWIAGIALLAKELLFRYLLSRANRIKSSMLIANAWHARSDAASSLVVGIGIVGNISGYPIMDPLAALAVGLMVSRMGWKFGWDALQDLMDRGADKIETDAIRHTLLDTPGVRGVHELRTRKMGDMLIVDAHIEVEGSITVKAGHDIAVSARERVMLHHPVLDLLTHIDPWHQPDLDHAPIPASQKTLAHRH